MVKLTKEVMQKSIIHALRNSTRSAPLGMKAITPFVFDAFTYTFANEQSKLSCHMKTFELLCEMQDAGLVKNLGCANAANEIERMNCSFWVLVGNL